MPNWAEGIIKIRGSEENIINFLKGALVPIGIMGERANVEITEDDFDVTLKSEGGGFHIKGTRRAFIEGDVEFYKSEDEKTHVLVLDTFKQAWGVIPEPLAELSKEFKVDIKIHAFEKGMEFQQEVEIINGEIVTNNENTFDNYQWECIMPNLGG